MSEAHKLKTGTLVRFKDPNKSIQLYRIIGPHGQRNTGTEGFENEYALEIVGTTVAGESEIEEAK